jgi:hypothetical protein
MTTVCSFSNSCLGIAGGEMVVDDTGWRINPFGMSWGWVAEDRENASEEHSNSPGSTPDNDDGEEEQITQDADEEGEGKKIVHDLLEKYLPKSVLKFMSQKAI